MDTEYVDSAEAAAILQVSAGRVAHSIAIKAGLSYRRVGRAYLFRRQDVERLAMARGGRRGPGRPKKAVTA